MVKIDLVMGFHGYLGYRSSCAETIEKDLEEFFSWKGIKVSAKLQSFTKNYKFADMILEFANIEDLHLVILCGILEKENMMYYPREGRIYFLSASAKEEFVKLVNRPEEIKEMLEIDG